MKKMGDKAFQGTIAVNLEQKLFMFQKPTSSVNQLQKYLKYNFKKTDQPQTLWN